MLKKQHRLKSSSDIKNVLAHGKSTRSGFLFLKFSANELDVSRFAFSVGTSYSKSAVKRNYLKRRLRIAVANNLGSIKHGFDCVFFLGKGVSPDQMPDPEKQVLRCLTSANLIKNK